MKKFQKTITKSQTSIAVRVYLGIAGGIALIAVGFSGSLYLLRPVEIEGIQRGTYSAPHAEVPYVACIPSGREPGDAYPAFFFTPGFKQQLENWIPHCQELANQGFVTMMIERPGTDFEEWLAEVTLGVEFLKSFAFVENDAVDIMGSSFGNLTVQYYTLMNPDEVQGYIDLSGKNNPFVINRAELDYAMPILMLSGGGEFELDMKDCDTIGFEWTEEFYNKLVGHNPTGPWQRKVYDEETYGCARHGFLWIPDHPATQDALLTISAFLRDTIGTGPLSSNSQSNLEKL